MVGSSSFLHPELGFQDSASRNMEPLGERLWKNRLEQFGNTFRTAAEVVPEMNLDGLG